MSNLKADTEKIRPWMKDCAHVVELTVDGIEKLYYVAADVEDGGDPAGRWIDVNVWGMWEEGTGLPAPGEIFDNHEEEIVEAILHDEGIQTRSRPLR